MLVEPSFVLVNTSWPVISEITVAMRSRNSQVNSSYSLTKDVDLRSYSACQTAFPGS